MTPAGERALWIVAVLLLLVIAGGGGNHVESGFTATVDDNSLDLRLDLNGAGIEELESLPGIGPALAGRIEGHRRDKGPFQSVEDLAAVPGIGAVTIRRVTPFLTLGNPHLQGKGMLSETGE